MVNGKVLVFGGVGAGTTVAMGIVDANRKGHNDLVFAGYINDKDAAEGFDGFPVVGGMADVPRLVAEGYSFINTIYKVDGMQHRIALFEGLAIPDEQLARFIHPQAYVAPNVTVGAGCVVMANASVSSAVRLGRNVRVMNGAMVGHDNNIADHAFFAANACIGSHLEVGTAAYFGLNCTVGGKLNVGPFAVIGMGSVVTKHVEPYAIVAGNPAKTLRYVKDKPVDPEEGQ